MARQATLKIGRKTLAFGLTWQTPEPDVSPQRAAQAFNRDVGNVADIAVYRSEPVAQFALGSSKDGLRAGMHSAAAILANTLQSSWLVAMETPIGVWICSGRDDCLLPDGDLLFDDETDARAEFEQRLNQGGWTTIFAPAGWGYGADEIVPDALGSGTLGSGTRLVEMASARGYVRLAMLVGLMGGAVLLGMTYLWPRQEVEEIVIDPAVVAQEQQAMLDEEMRPWRDMPAADALLANCIDALRDLPTGPGGFTADAANCTNGSAALTLTRIEGGFVSWLREWAEARQKLSVAVDPTGESATLSRDFAALDAAGDFETLPALGEVATWLQERAQIEGGTVAISDPVVPVRDDYPDYVPLYAEAAVTIATSHPDLWVAGLGDRPGFRIRSVALNLQDMTYTIEGTLYVSNR